MGYRPDISDRLRELIEVGRAQAARSSEIAEEAAKSLERIAAALRRRADLVQSVETAAHCLTEAAYAEDLAQREHTAAGRFREIAESEGPPPLRTTRNSHP